MKSSADAKRIIAEYVEYHIAVAEFVFGIELPQPAIRYRCRGRTVGQSRYTERSIDFSLIYACEHTDVLVCDTIPHEVAHYVTDHLFPNIEEAHSPEWYDVAKALGMYDPQSKMRPMILSTHHVVRCVVCGTELGLTAREYHNLQLGYHHAPCGPGGTFQYVSPPITHGEHRNDQERDAVNSRHCNTGTGDAAVRSDRRR